MQALCPEQSRLRSTKQRRRACHSNRAKKDVDIGENTDYA